MPRKSDLSTEEIEKLSVLVQNESCIYKVTDPDYHDKIKLFNTWERIAREMGNSQLNGESWRKKWRNLRDTYVKKRRETKAAKSGQGAVKRIRWPYMDILNFLDKHVHENVTESNLELDDNSEIGLDSEIPRATSEVPSECEDLSGSELDRCGSTQFISRRDSMADAVSELSYAPAHISKPVQHTPKSRKRGKRRDDPFENTMVELVNCYKQQREEQREKNYETAEDAFFQSCRLRIKKLAPPIKSALQLQISQLFFNAENPDLQPQPIVPLPQIQRNQNEYTTSHVPVPVIPDHDVLPENILSTAMVIANVSNV